LQTKPFKYINRISLALLLSCFILANIFSSLHSFSHKISADLVLSEKSNSSQSHDLSHCSLCLVSNFSEKTTFSIAIFFAFLSFALSFNARVFDRVKWSYLNSSFLSRAPPKIS